MSVTLQQILSAKNLTGIITDVAGGVPSDIVSPQFMNITKPVVGDDGVYIVRNNTRRSSRQAEYGAKARARNKQGIAERPVKLIHTVEEINHKPTTLMNLVAPNDVQRQRIGAEEVAYQTSEFGRIFQNLRWSCVYSMLSKGQISFGEDGEIADAPVADGFDINYKVPAENRNQLDGIIDASWADPSTDIVGQLNALDVKARQTTGMPIKDVYFGENILGYLLANESVKALLQSNSALAAALTARQIPEGFMGKSWTPVYEAFYENEAGASVNWWNADAVTFAPKLDRSWYELQVGSYPLPTTIGNMFGDANGALASFREVHGMYSYANVSTNPPAISHVAGDTFLPVLKVPKALYFADVTP